MTDPKSDALIVFTPSGKRGRFALGTPVLQAARSLGVDIDSVCGGRALCGRCQVTLSSGEFAKHGISSRAELPGARTTCSTSDVECYSRWMMPRRTAAARAAVRS